MSQRRRASDEAIGIEGMHKQVSRMATLVQELRNEEQFLADLANGVV